jgi:ATP synthase protein I
VRNRQGWQSASRLLKVELFISLLLSSILGLVYGLKAFGSGLLGGAVCLLPNTYFAYRLFEHHGAKAAKKIVKSFYQGEALKIMLTFGLFAGVWRYVEVAPLPFLLVFIASQMVFWAAPLIIRR